MLNEAFSSFLHSLVFGPGWVCFFFNTEHLWLLSLNIFLNNDALEA